MRANLSLPDQEKYKINQWYCEHKFLNEAIHKYESDEAHEAAERKNQYTWALLTMDEDKWLEYCQESGISPEARQHWLFE